MQLLPLHAVLLQECIIRIDSSRNFSQAAESLCFAPVWMKMTACLFPHDSPHDSQHRTYAVSQYPLPANPLISMLHPHEVRQKFWHLRTPLFQPRCRCNDKIKGRGYRGDIY